MRKSYLIGSILVVIILILGVWFVTNNQSPKETVTIIMKQDSFEPQTLEIKKGTKVIFKNEDKVERWPASNLHPTHGIYPEFDPQKPVPAGESWEFIFDKAGSWKYHDHLIPSIRGVIIVH